MGNIFSDCFTQKQKDSDRQREEEENKHHELTESSNTCIITEEKDEETKHQHERNSASADRISDLPDDILRLILSFLPFKSVGQTSVLSRRWNHLWSSYPIIDFYEIFTGNEAVHHQTKARIINTVLACRNENYNIMVSRVGRYRNYSCLPRVEELVLDISSWSENRSDLPRCQLKCHTLRSLESKTSSSRNSKAWLEFPSSYVVGSYLRSLHTLSLNHVDFLDSDLDVELFSGSSFPSLEKLNIESCGGVRDLKISCPNLKYLDVLIMNLNSLDISGMRLEKLTVVSPFKRSNNGSWVDIFAPNLQSFGWASSAFTGKCSIQSFPTLKGSYMAYWWIDSTTTKIHNNGVALLSSSSQVEEFEISYNSLGILSGIYFELGGLPFSFMKLKNLTIGTVFDKQEIPGVACLLKSSPVVDTLKIYFRSTERKHHFQEWNNTLLDDANCTEEQYWETQAQYLSPFLRVAEIDVGELMPENAVNFAKFLLKYGRGLQKMILHFRRSQSCLRFNPRNDAAIALIKGFPRASADVEFSKKICAPLLDSFFLELINYKKLLERTIALFSHFTFDFANEFIPWSYELTNLIHVYEIENDHIVQMNFCN